MRSGIVELFAFGLAAVWLVGCEDPLASSRDQSVPMSRAGGGSSGLTSNAVSPTQVDLAWPDNSSNESGFEAHRSTTGPTGAYVALGTTGANVTSYSDKGLTAEKKYCYKVRAFTTSGRKTSYSAFTNTSCATTPPLAPPPPQPQGPTAPSGVNAKQEGFRVERSASVDGPWVAVWTADPNNTLANIYAQPYDQQLCYRVIAFKGKGESPSNIDCTYLPNGPTDLTATAVGTEAVDLAWSDNSSVEDGYDIERSETGGNPFTLVASVEGNSTTYLDTGVSHNATYWYRVAVKREGGRSGLSETVSVLLASVPPDAPSGTRATPNGSTSVLVEWTDTSNEVGFRIDRSTDGGMSWIVVGSANANYPAFFDNGLPPEQRYCYRVVAFNGLGESEPSSAACTTLLAAPTDLVAILIDGSTVDLRWADVSSSEDGYVVVGWYGGSEEPSEIVAELPANSTSYRDVRIYPYSVYWVVARKDDTYSDWSNGATPATSGSQSSTQSRMLKAIRPPGSELRMPVTRAP
jgi:fibronectin type 3 domain-containing protein